MPGFDIRTIPKLPLFNISSSYYLYDRFDTALAAGAVIGSAAEPVGGTREGVDTNGKISVANGLLTFATGGASNNGVFYGAQARVVGKTALFYIVPSATTNQLAVGTSLNQTGLITNRLNLTSTGIIGTGGVATAAYTATPYNIALVMRGAGHFYFVKGGAFTNWTLLWMSTASEATQYPGIQYNGVSTAFTADNPRIPKQLYIPVPLQSDGMSATTTDGLGNPENNGIVGTAYEDFGTWGVSGGVRSCSVLGGATGSSVLATTTKNVHIEVKVVRSAGFAGISARREDSSNYIRCTHDGTNVIVTQLIAGSPTVLSTTAVAYSAGAVLKFDLEGTAYRAYYNNTAGGTGTVTDTSSFNHGLITSGTANTFDNLVIWAKGIEGQYSALNNL